jgi:3-oxo-5alpha-steroid 4-dehydrogenase
MAAGLAASVAGLDRIEVGIPLTPPRSIVRGILVNSSGERFMNEDTYSGRLGQEFLLRQGGKVYFVHSDETFSVNIVGYKPKWVAETAAELEAEIGFPAGALPRTLDRYNAGAAIGEDPEFHKASEWIVPLEPPFGVVNLSVDKSYYAPFTLGGIVTTTDSEVIDGTGSPIPGLFAAGRTTAGIAAGGYASGISLGDGTFFGRAAGRSAASRTPA